MSDVGSDESNDMIMDHPDIEKLEQKREKNQKPIKEKQQKKFKKRMIKDEAQTPITKEPLEKLKNSETEDEAQDPIDEEPQKKLKKRMNKDEAQKPITEEPQEKLKKSITKDEAQKPINEEPQKKLKKGMTKDEALQEREFYRLLKLEEKRLAEEERKKKLEENRRAKQEMLEQLILLRQKKQEEKQIAEEDRMKMKEERKIAREENIAKLKEMRQQKLEAKKIAEEEAINKRKEKALKGIKYLLSISEKYSDFFKEKIVADTKKNNVKPLQERNKFQPTVSDMKEAVDTGEQKDSGKGLADVEEKLSYFEGGTLRQYQIDGVQWMNGLFDNGINGILADEMGLGKTIQVIALICHLLERNILGPFLIVVPLSTLPNWEAEFARFAPKVPVIVFHGSRSVRAAVYSKIKKKYSIDNIKSQPVVLTSYQVPQLEKHFLGDFEWQYIIVDEGHRVKNHESQLSKILRSFTSANRLLLTGTPLQNNISELWSLLNFLMPHIFNNMDTFASLLMLEDVQDENKLLEQEEKNNIISTLHRVLKPFMLRRLKKDVLTDMVPKKEMNIFCPLSKLQKDLYSFVIERNIAQLQGKKEEEEDISDQPRKKRKCIKNAKFSYSEKTEDDDFSDYDEELIRKEEKLIGSKIDRTRAPFITRLTMQNTAMMFRKIVDHPYLVHFPLDPNSDKKELLIDENLVLQSGKMMVLDEMLTKLKKKGHKVLIFSTLVMTLDLIEDFMLMRGHTYCRLDGSIGLEARGECISEFNGDRNVLAFLLSTRAGGLGLNLVGADTVIFFDRDWNPQVDIQAQDRCHRIGQTRPVMVYTLITKNTIDEHVLTLGYQKRLLEKLVIKDGKFRMLKSDDKAKAESELRELQELLKQESDTFEGLGFSNEEMDKLLDRSELYKIMEESKSVKD